MLARLLWKEARIFGPVWVASLLAAAALDGFLFVVNRVEVRAGGLTTVNLVWALLYALATASAAFAGEREANTLGFLDALPVGRRRLWAGKLTFVVGSSLGLALLLVLMGEFGVEQGRMFGHRRYETILMVLGTLMVEAVGWGLFWSATSKNPLIAAAMSFVCVGTSLMFSSWIVYRTREGVSPARQEIEVVSIRLALAAAALAGSAVVMAWRPRGGWSLWRRPIPSTSRPIVARAASTGRSLIWQAGREGWTTGLLAVLLGLIVPIGLRSLDPPTPGIVEFCLVVIAFLVSGVSVFGTDDASKGRQFLVHHGVRPGTAWRWKFLAWGAGMAAFLGLMLVSSVLYGVPLGGHGFTTIGDKDLRFGLLLMTVVNAFLVGVVCGMVVRRRITAVLVGLMGFLAIFPIQLGLVSREMIPTWSWLLVPLILVGISRAWAADWLLEREGLRPWMRLGALIVVPFGLLGVAYIAYRELSVPDVGPQFDPAVVRAPVLAPDQDAVELYRRAGGQILGEENFYNDNNGSTSVPVDRVIAEGWDPKQEKVVRFWKNNQGAIDLARRASTRPGARFEPYLASMSITSARAEWERHRTMKMLGQLLGLDIRERLSRGDLPGAWDDILVQFRIGSQLVESSPTISQMRSGCEFHHQAVGLAFEWLGDARQAPETIRRALADLKSFPPVPDLSETLQVESSIVERSLDLSPDVIADVFAGSGTQMQSALPRLFFTKFVAAPWERSRARRVCRVLFAEELRVAKLEPWQRDPLRYPAKGIEPDFMSSTLARMLIPSFESATSSLDGEMVGRRALEQALSLVAWKFDHGGAYPGKLEDLVPGLLDRLPPDPYSGRPFGYVRTPGRPMPSKLVTPPERPESSGRPHLYSVGPDRIDQEARSVVGPNTDGPGDLVFALPGS